VPQRAQLLTHAFFVAFCDLRLTAAVCGAMYGGCFGAAAVLGHVGTLRLTFAFLTDFAQSLREENPKLSVPASYMLAVRKFINDN
jgi:hypothetical protein